MRRWYITFHGGDAEDAWNNIHAFDLSGSRIGKTLDTHSLPHGIRLRELRGFAFGPDGDLYVANAYKNASQVLRFSGTLDAKGRHRFRDVFSSLHPANPGLDHPFDVTFGPDGQLFVPSQDTNVVGRYFGPQPLYGHPGAPMPYPAALTGQADDALPPGTFVPSRHHAPNGLHAVRGTSFGEDGNLYVADRDCDSVKSYHGASGAFLREFKHPHLSKPVHLHAAGKGRVVVGSRDADTIQVIDTKSGGVHTLVAPGAGGLHGPAGMALGPDGKLYVCSRESRQILRFDATTGAPDASPFIDDLPDCPEFIALIGQ